MSQQKILVAPLNWGLGHATRCIPIINQLLKNGFEPVLASDGQALLLLQKEFPNLKSYSLPAYPIKYPKMGFLLKWTLILKWPKFRIVYKAEQLELNRIVKLENLKGVISDNRFGCFHPEVKSVYITHQLQVLSGVFTRLTSKIHQNIIKNYDECWIPDEANFNLSGRLSIANNITIRSKYIGLLSRFSAQEAIVKYDYLILLSGQEPQRTQLEIILLKAFKNTDKKIILIQGLIAEKQTTVLKDNITIVNFMTGVPLQNVISQSEIVMARSGYSTIMDLATMQKRAFFIPTPGQDEQIYLAKNLENQGIAPFAWQHKFKIQDLDKLNNFKGFVKPITKPDWSDIFSIFK